MANPNPNIKDYGFGGKFRTREQDDEYRNRIKGVPRWTKERALVRLSDILDRLDKLLLEANKVESKPEKLKLETIRDLKIMMNTLLDYLRYLYPPVQTNVNLDINIGEEKEKKIKEYFTKKYNIIFVEKIIREDKDESSTQSN